MPKDRGVSTVSAEDTDDADRNRRLILLLLVVGLSIIGTGIGSIILTGPDTQPPDNETTPTSTVTTATPTATPGSPGPPSDTPTVTATPTDTATPADTATGSDSDSDGTNGGGSQPPATPSPGLELGEGESLFEGSNLAPGQSGQGTLTLRNAEDEDGNLTVTSVAITDEENGITDPESAVDSTPDEGELSSALEVRLSIDDGNSQTYLLGTESGYATLEELPDDAPSDAYGLASGEEVTLVMDWRLPSSAGNEIQSDGVSVDLGLLLESTET